MIERSEMLKVLEALLQMTNALDGPEFDSKKSQTKCLKKKAEAHVDEIMKQLDKNGDNLLQLEEFVDGCLSDEFIRQILVDPMFKCW